MRLLETSEILNLVDYEKVRDARRREIIELKRHRRVSVGRYLTFVFENRETVWFQIQEMVRAERLVDAERIAEEVEVYNTLLPGPERVVDLDLLRDPLRVHEPLSADHLLDLEPHGLPVLEDEREIAAHGDATVPLELDDLAAPRVADLLVVDEVQDLRRLELPHGSLLETVRGGENPDRMLRLPARPLLDLEGGERAVGRGHGRVGARDRVEQRLRQLQGELVVLRLEPPGPVHRRALLHHVDLGARDQAKHVRGLVPDVLGAEVARHVVGHGADRLREARVEPSQIG